MPTSPQEGTSFPSSVRGSGGIAVAVVGAVGAVRAALDDLPRPPRVAEFADLYSSAQALTEFAPQVLILGSTAGSDRQTPRADSELDQTLGALAVLAGLLPEFAVWLVAPADQLTKSQRAACAAHDVAVLDPDADLQDLEARLEQAVGCGDPTARYLEFVQGICDEINNPLMFASGHLQLLASRLDPEDDREPLAQVAAIRQGLSRIAGTMRKVSAMGRASAAGRQRSPFTIDEVVGATEAQIRGSGLAAGVACPDDARELVLRGDPDLVAGALFGLCQVGAELNADAPDVVLQVRPSTRGVELQMEVQNSRLETWELRRAFEPYHLNGVLRGTTLGLNLFLVRLVTRAHGWNAFARRLSGPRVEFSIGPAPTTPGTPSTPSPV
jgi:signal transduction histidine kinase